MSNFTNYVPTNVSIAERSLNELAKQMGKTVDQLDVSDIQYLEAYLNHLKRHKLRNDSLTEEIPRAKYCNSVGSLPYNPNEPITQANQSYYNPYQYGGNKKGLGMLYKPNYVGPYDVQKDVVKNMGLASNIYQEKFPNEIRNVNLESVLVQSENTHIPGQRVVTEKEINRFNMLPFDPQDTRHIIWFDQMPRGGYATRLDRLETNK